MQLAFHEERGTFVIFCELDIKKNVAINVFGSHYDMT